MWSGWPRDDVDMSGTHLRAVPSVPESDAPDFDEVAEELYSGAPEEFVATRNRHERQAKQAGERDLAARIHALSKPNATAWLANQLARQHAEELRSLVELGAGLREATRNLAGDELRTMSRQQHELVYALVQQCRQIAHAVGRTVSDDTTRGLQQILHAALADEQVADLLIAGRLTETIRRSGLGDGDTGPVGSVQRKAPRATARTAAKATLSDPAKLKRAENELAEADKAVTDATKERDDAAQRVSAAKEVVEKAAGRTEQLQQQLDEARNTQAEVEKEYHAQRIALDRADRSLRDATQRRSIAATQHDRLSTRET